MVNRKVWVILATLLALLAVPVIQAQPEYTVQLGVSGPGTLTWVGMYEGSVYTSGSTSESIAITVPRETLLTFTANPQPGNSFAYWTVDHSDQGSTSPLVTDTLGLDGSSFHSVFANFVLPVQYAVANPPLQNSQPGTFNVGVAGLGKVYWSSSYNGVALDSGWVDGSSSVAIPEGAMVTFTAVPLSGHHFSNWVIDGVDQGSNNPFVMYGTGETLYANVVANFDQTFYANPPLQSVPT